jgi:hypothetical protein
MPESAPVTENRDLIEPAYEDYYGFKASKKWYFPDGLQYIEFKVMSEGDRKRFQSETRADLELVRTTGNARMKMDPGTERWTLLEGSVIGWNVQQRTPNGWKAVPFDKQKFQQWLGGADPKLVDDFEKAVRKANPWLLQDMTVEDIDKEIDNLKEMREIAVKREQGEAASSGR